MSTLIMKSDEARTRFRDVIDEVIAGRSVLIERYNKPVGVFIPHDKWEAFQIAEAFREARQVRERITSGESNLTSIDEVKRLMLEKRAANVAH